MLPKHQDLWDRIERYQLDKPQAAFPFSAKLAQENHWSIAFAQRAVEEYKRFVFLGIVAGHPVSPSQVIDEVWHLHLTYSEEYHERFCPNVLGRPFHHYPSEGGNGESAKFEDWYAKTLASYSRFFQDAPPAEFWPSPGLQLSGHSDDSEVNRGTHWIIPKPELGFRLHHAPLILVVAMVVGCVNAPSSVSPLDYTGPQFLAFYFWLELFCLAAGASVLHVIRSRGELSGSGPALDPNSVAVLAGGKQLLAYSATVGLLQREAVRFDRVDGKFTLAAETVQDCTPVESRLFAWLQEAGPVSPTMLALSLTDDVKKIDEHLRQVGYIADPMVTQRAQWTSFLVSLIAPTIGVIKVFIGVSREKPVGFLVLFCIVSLVMSLAIFARPIRVSLLGNAELRRMRERLSSLRRTNGGMTPEMVMTGVGLFGVESLAYGPHHDLVTVFQPSRRSGHGSCSGGSSCGGSISSGDGGGSCGGGGGGSGCGGCGGGH